MKPRSFNNPQNIADLFESKFDQIYNSGIFFWDTNFLTRLRIQNTGHTVVIEAIPSWVWSKHDDIILAYYLI